jgi:hypothetical protein
MSVIADPAFDLRLVPTIMDIEASGFGRGSYPIEVGFVLPDGRSDCMLIRRKPEWQHWDPGAESLHGISRELLARYGRPLEDVVDRLEAQLAGRTVYSDGWGNDYSWLSILYDAVGRRPGFRIDSLEKLLTEEELGRWDTTKATVFREAARERHRASADARLLQSTVIRLRSAPSMRR